MGVRRSGFSLSFGFVSPVSPPFQTYLINGPQQVPMAGAFDIGWGVLKSYRSDEVYEEDEEEDKDAIIAQLRREIEKLKLEQLRVKRQEQCECEHMLPEDQPCNACSNQWRNERYGSDVHDVECVCDQCRGVGYRGADY